MRINIYNNGCYVGSVESWEQLEKWANEHWPQFQELTYELDKK